MQTVNPELAPLAVEFVPNTTFARKNVNLTSADQVAFFSPKSFSKKKAHLCGHFLGAIYSPGWTEEELRHVRIEAWKIGVSWLSDHGEHTILLLLRVMPRFSMLPEGSRLQTAKRKHLQGFIVISNNCLLMSRNVSCVSIAAGQIECWNWTSTKKRWTERRCRKRVRWGTSCFPLDSDVGSSSKAPARVHVPGTFLAVMPRAGSVFFPPPLLPPGRSIRGTANVKWEDVWGKCFP